MNWALLILCVATSSGPSLGAYQQYNHQPQAHQGYQELQYQPRAHQGYQGPPVVPVILPGGFIADTEEVAKAKDLHFNAFAHAASTVKDSRYNPAEDGRQSYNQQPRYTQAAVHQPAYSPPQHEYTNPQHNAVEQQYTGPISRTTYPEAKSVGNYRPAYSSQPRYQGPPVIPVILPNGYIAETADVEAAKEHHFQLVAQAQAAVARAQERENKNKYSYPTAYTQQSDDGEQYEDQGHNYQEYQVAPSSPVYSQHSQHSQQPYKGPQAVPVVLPSGHIADTAEVAAAKISHLQQLLETAQQSLPHTQQRYHHSR